MTSSDVKTPFEQKKDLSIDGIANRLFDHLLYREEKDEAETDPDHAYPDLNVTRNLTEREALTVLTLPDRSVSRRPSLSGAEEHIRDRVLLVMSEWNRSPSEDDTVQIVIKTRYGRPERISLRVN